MREIKFKGLDKNGVWQYGDFCQVEIDGTKGYIILKEQKSNLLSRFVDKLVKLLKPNLALTHNLDEVAVVIPDTVCQYIGMTDCFGEKIYEGDIVKTEIIDISILDLKTITGYIEYKYNQFMIIGNDDEYIFSFDASIASKDIEVIGNIHDKKNETKCK